MIYSYAEHFYICLKYLYRLLLASVIYTKVYVEILGFSLQTLS